MTVMRFRGLDQNTFEQLCADLLEVEGFIVQSRPSPSQAGSMVVLEEYRSHRDRSVEVPWRVVCKFYGTPDRNLGRKEAEVLLHSHEIVGGIDQGLFLIVDTDFDDAAKSVIDEFVSQHQGARTTLWNHRQLATRLDRHPHLLHRYGLSTMKSDYLSILGTLEEHGPVRTLLISDQSVLAHNLTSGLRAAGFEITFLPFWNYIDPARLSLIRNTILKDDFGLVICFLGDSFTVPLPQSLIEVIQLSHRKGAAMLLFPFLAWSIHRGLHSALRDIVPVRLQNPEFFSPETATNRVAGSHRRGDFRWLLSFDSFAEDLYTELDPSDGCSPFTDGIEARFGLSHSFEFLAVTRGSELIWVDTAGNPMIVVNRTGSGKVCYFNTCCHSCMNPVPVLSPLESSTQASLLIRNTIRWLLS